MDWHDRISVNSAVRSGKPCIRIFRESGSQPWTGVAPGRDFPEALARVRFRGLKRVVASTQPPDVARKLEYLEEALDEAEATARWYAERSATAAAAFSEEIDAAESEILRLPDAWPRYDDTRRYLLRRFPFSIIYRGESIGPKS
jgi:hypothetical protein